MIREVINSALPRFKDLSGQIFSAAKEGAVDLLGELEGFEYSSKDLSRVESAVDLMFEAHRAQMRPNGKPYVNHTLLVAKIVVKKFGITDPDVVVAALLHDGPEDQAARILELSGQVSEQDPQKCIEIIGATLGARPERVRQYLSDLTNPDFEQMVQILKPVSVAKTDFEAESLFYLYQEESGDGRVPADLPDADLKKALYLGHVIALAKKNEPSFTVKMADFYANGLHRHLLLEDVVQMQRGAAKDVLTQKAVTLDKKYGPVVNFLKKHFRSALERDVVLITPKADDLLRKKIAFAEQFYS